MATPVLGKNARKPCFWISYAAGPDETPAKFDYVLSKVFGAECTHWGDDEVRDRRYFDAIVAAPQQKLITSVCNKRKWTRAGASGQLVDIRWPRYRQSPMAFVKEWTECLKQRNAARERASFLGDETALKTAVNIAMDRVTIRSIGSKERKETQGRNLCNSYFDGTPAVLSDVARTTSTKLGMEQSQCASEDDALLNTEFSLSLSFGEGIKEFTGKLLSGVGNSPVGDKRESDCSLPSLGKFYDVLGVLSFVYLLKSFRLHRLF